MLRTSSWSISESEKQCRRLISVIVNHCLSDLFQLLYCRPIATGSPSMSWSSTIYLSDGLDPPELA